MRRRATLHGITSRFASEIEDAELYRLLEVALRGRGAFGRFKGGLSEHPDERERWFRVREAFIADRQREWLAGLGIVPAE